MPMRTQNIPVPLGGGLQEDVDEARLGPPYASEASNAVVRQGQAYEKSPGWDSKGSGNSGTGGAKALVVGDEERMIVLGQDNNTEWSSNLEEWQTYGPGWIPPIGVDVLPTLSMRGRILDVGIAHHKASGLTALFVAHQAGALLPGCDAVILDADGGVVSGPFKIPTITFFPRVEAITDGSDNAVFVFVGSTNTGLTASPVLEYFTINAGSLPTSAPTPATLVTGGYGNNLSSYVYAYDTHSVSTHDKAYIVTYNGASVTAAAIDSTGSITGAGAVKAGVPGALQIFHDEVSETVLVTESGSWDSVFYANESLSSWTEVTGLHVETKPLIYKTALGVVTFSGEDITLTGSAPATPSVTGTAAYDTSEVGSYRPQPWTGNTRAMFFQQRNGGIVQGGVGGSVTGLSTSFAEATRLEAMFIHSDGLAYPAVPVLQSRHGPHLPDGFLIPFGSAYRFGHVPQTAQMSDGTVLVPCHVRVPASKAWIPTYDRGEEAERYEEGHGLNMDHQVLLTKLSPVQAKTDVDYLPFRGATLIAAGGTKVWDGGVLFDPPAPPLIADYDDSSGAATGVTRSDHTEIENSTGGTYTNIKFWAMRIVLVFTDRFGTEWRSSPSPIWTQDSIANIAGAFVCPRISITLDDSHQRVLRQGGSYDVEVYVTTRDEGDVATGAVGANTEAELVYTFWACQRTPLLEDGTGYFVPDFLKVAASPEATGLPYLKVPIPLYTDSGELAPTKLPASSSLAAAGNYAFLNPSEFPYEIWPSKPVVPGIGPEFPPELIINAPAGSGGVVSMAGQGDRLIVLCRHGVYELYAGTGPDSSGAGGFGAMRLVQMGDGCVNRRGTVATPAGVFFLSASGVKLVGGQGGVEDVGRYVQTTLGAPADVVAATYRDVDREVWWHRSDGVCAVLSLDEGVWTSVERVSTTVVSAGVSSELVHHLNDSGVLYAEDSTLGSDDASALVGYQMTVTTPWLSFDKRASFFRCRRIFLTGRVAGGTGDLVVKVSYDYQDTVIDTMRWSYSGSEGLSSLDRGVQIRLRPSRQKFDAIKVSVYDTDPSGSGESERTSLRWALTGVELEVAAKQGGIKLQAEASR